jgi:hypothetical protein
MRSVIYSLIGLLVVTAILTVVPAYAQESTMTDEHIARIKSNCGEALGTLSRIHINDAPVYINRNQTYFSISDKLMARLNSRLTLNRYDATQLVKIASEYNSALTKFRTAYNRYEDTMADLLKMNCVKQPVSFYDGVADARSQRQEVNDLVGQLKTLIDLYGDEVKAFKSQHATQLNGTHL